jgi:hypothetical protein
MRWNQLSLSMGVASLFPARMQAGRTASPDEEAIMTARLLVLAALLAGCGVEISYVRRTRITAGGGEYTLYANSPQSVASGVGQALASISADCTGTYEVVGVELLPTSPKGSYGYLDTTLMPAWGSFLTGIAYECRPPESATLNQRLQAIAATVPPQPPAAPPAPPAPPPPPEPCLVTYDCPVGRVCAPTQAACDGR